MVLDKNKNLLYKRVASHFDYFQSGAERSFTMLLEKLKGWLLGSRQEISPQPDPTPVAGRVDWAPVIWAYTQSLIHDSRTRQGRDKARDECDSMGRGLAFGKIRIPSLDFGLRAALLGEPKFDIATVRTALEQALGEFGFLERVSIKLGGRFDKGFDVDILREDDPLPVSVRSPERPDGSHEYRRFLTIETWFTDSPHIEANTVESLRVFLRMAEILGYPAGPKHYANETPVRIEDIVVYALRWEDEEHRLRFLDVLYRPELVVSQVFSTHDGYGSIPQERVAGAYKRRVVISRMWGMSDDAWPQMRINNRPVYSTISETPTQAMLDEREVFLRTPRPSFGAC